MTTNQPQRAKYRSKLGVALAGFVLFALPLLPTATAPAAEPGETEQPPSSQAAELAEYLGSKGSPLAEHAELLVQQPHWRTLVAISRIESQWCTRKIDFNCWGIIGSNGYRHYTGYPEAILDAEALHQRWNERGRWLTVDDMNCHYVQPCNPTWVLVVNETLQELNTLIPPQ